jgi:sugar lactone lactonase YvrE
VLSEICPDYGGNATVALANPHGLALDEAGNVFVANTGTNSILKIAPGGTLTEIVGTVFHEHPRRGQAMLDQQLNYPTDVVVNQAGELYVADTLNHRVRRVAKDGTVATVVGTGVAGFSGDGGPALSARLNRPYGLTLNAAGDLYIADTANNRVRKVSFGSAARPRITTVAGNGRYASSGDGGRATNASITVPRAVAVDRAGNLLIGDFDNNRLRRVSADGIISTVDAVTGVNGIRSLAVDRANNVYLADSRNYAIRKLSPAGVMTTLPVAGRFGGRTAGSYKEPQDGGPAATAWIGSPTAIAADPAGNVYFVDVDDSCVRKISAAGIISTIVGSEHGFSGDGGPAVKAWINRPVGVAADDHGNIYIADGYNARIRKVSATGIITTIAGTGVAGHSGDGGLATRAQISILAEPMPTGIAVDAHGNIFFAEPGLNKVRRIAPSGIITTVAGKNSDSYRFGDSVFENGGFAGDGGPATAAWLKWPRGIAVLGDALFIADTGNNRIRRVSGGIITTIAGTGGGAYTGDGGPATNADVYYPIDVAGDARGRIYIAASGNKAIRMLEPR